MRLGLKEKNNTEYSSLGEKVIFLICIACAINKLLRHTISGHHEQAACPNAPLLLPYLKNFRLNLLLDCNLLLLNTWHFPHAYKNYCSEQPFFSRFIHFLSPSK